MQINKFKEFIGIRSIENYKEKLSIKIVFQQTLLLATFIIFMGMVIWSYSNGNQNFGVNELDDKLSLRLCRALFSVFLSWYLFCSIWAIKNSFDLLESNQKTEAIFLMLSFIPIFSIVNIGIFAKGINRKSIAYYKELLFSKDETLSYEYRWGTWRRYVLLGMLIVLSPIIAFVFFPDSESLTQSSHEQNIWFYSFNYFTIQTNTMIFMFTLISLICPSLKVFKNNNLQITLIVYIFIVGFSWNAILLPSAIEGGRFAILPTYKKVSTFWYHLVNPIVFIVCSLVLIFKQPFKETTKFSNIFRITMPYPAMYIIYLGTVPFTAGISVYGDITNVNPNLGLINNAVDLNSKSYGNYANFGILIGFWFIFLLLTLLVWYCDRKIDTPKVEKNKILVK